MKVQVNEPSDAVVDGKVKALFGGQVYDLPADVAEALIAAGKAEKFRDAPASEGVGAKAVESPPKTKAVRRKKTK